jgi:hypothetical protein
MMSLMVIWTALTVVPPASPRGSSRVGPLDGQTYPWIPPDSYFNGGPPEDRECYGLERHREKVVIANGCKIGRTEVPQAAYKRVINATPPFYIYRLLLR